jgi:GT2 family glycosyltransferase
VSIAAIVVNYRTPDTTAAAVASLAASHRAVDDIIVVDNGSEDGGCAMRARLPAGRVLATTRNLGFAGGANVGVRAAIERGAAHVLLVNSDATVTATCVAVLERAVATDDAVGIAGPLLLRSPSDPVVVSAGIRVAYGGVRVRETTRVPAEAVRRVDAVSGAVMLVARRVFERAGLFAEDYFFSFEDVDLALRARRAGLAAVVTSDAIAYHAGSASIGRASAERLYFATRNHLLLRSRIASGRALDPVIAVPGIVALNVLYALLRSPAGARGIAAVARGVIDHVRRRYGGARLAA